MYETIVVAVDYRLLAIAYVEMVVFEIKRLTIVDKQTKFFFN